MSDEYTISTNFQRSSDDPRAAVEYVYRLGCVREREAERDALSAPLSPPRTDQTSMPEEG